jgi:hypothetical protein
LPEIHIAPNTGRGAFRIDAHAEHRVDQLQRAVALAWRAGLHVEEQRRGRVVSSSRKRERPAIAGLFVVLRRVGGGGGI